MNQREISELRRRWRPDKSAVSRVYGCFVNSGKKIVSDLDESLGAMPQEEAEKYLDLLKKALSGALGKNLIDIVFSTQQVADSEEHRLLSALRASGLKDREARNAFYQKVIGSLDMGDDSYLLLMACDAYDVPHRSKDGEIQADASDEVFTYIVCCICPVKAGRPELGYFPGDNEFHYHVRGGAAGILPGGPVRPGGDVQRGGGPGGSPAAGGADRPAQGEQGPGAPGGDGERHRRNPPGLRRSPGEGGFLQGQL